MQKGRLKFKWDRDICRYQSSHTLGENWRLCLSPLSSPTHSEFMPRPGRHLPQLTKGSGREGCCLFYPPPQATS